MCLSRFKKKTFPLTSGPFHVLLRMVDLLHQIIWSSWQKKPVRRYITLWGHTTLSRFTTSLGRSWRQKEIRRSKKRSSWLSSIQCEMPSAKWEFLPRIVPIKRERFWPWKWADGCINLNLVLCEERMCCRSTTVLIAIVRILSNVKWGDTWV